VLQFGDSFAGYSKSKVQIGARAENRKLKASSSQIHILHICLTTFNHPKSRVFQEGYPKKTRTFTLEVMRQLADANDANGAQLKKTFIIPTIPGEDW